MGDVVALLEGMMWHLMEYDIVDISYAEIKKIVEFVYIKDIDIDIDCGGRNNNGWLVHNSCRSRNKFSFFSLKRVS